METHEGSQTWRRDAIAELGGTAQFSNRRPSVFHAVLPWCLAWARKTQDENTGMPVKLRGHHRAEILAGPTRPTGFSYICAAVFVRNIALLARAARD